MPLSSDRPLVFPAPWGHERAWFVIDPSAPAPQQVREDFVQAVARARVSAWRRIIANIAGWTTFLACAAAIPIVWVASGTSPAWVPLAAIASVVAFIAAIFFGGSVHGAIAPGMSPSPPRYVEPIPDFIVSWADDDLAESALWALAIAANRAGDLRDNFMSESLTEALGPAYWVADDVLEPAMLAAWRVELARMSELAPGLPIPHDLKPHRPDDVHRDPSLTA